jgi:hypothetical protein
MDDSSQPSDQKLDILFVTSDLYPPFRPAAKAVFAEGLAARGHRPRIAVARKRSRVAQRTSRGRTPAPRGLRA